MTAGSLSFGLSKLACSYRVPTLEVYVENNGRWQMAAHQSGRSPAGGEVDVEVQDPDNNAVYRKSLPLSAAGRFMAISTSQRPQRWATIQSSSTPAKLRSREASTSRNTRSPNTKCA